MTFHQIILTTVGVHPVCHDLLTLMPFQISITLSLFQHYPVHSFLLSLMLQI